MPVKKWLYAQHVFFSFINSRIHFLALLLAFCCHWLISSTITKLEFLFERSWSKFICNNTIQAMISLLLEPIFIISLVTLFVFSWFVQKKLKIRRWWDFLFLKNICNWMTGKIKLISHTRWIYYFRTCLHWISTIVWAVIIFHWFIIKLIKVILKIYEGGFPLMDWIISLNLWHTYRNIESRIIYMKVFEGLPIYFLVCVYFEYLPS